MLEVKLTPSRDGIEIGSVTVQFMRTLRIPDDGRQHPLPPGLGEFPVRRVADYADRVPAEWARHGGVFLPMHEREAMWMSFDAPEEEPHALKVAMGMVNAVTGKPWSEQLDRADQDYVVLPYQPWLDGIKTEQDSIRQFVAMPLGEGYTVEGQLTGEEQYGGLQLLAFPAKPGAIPPPERMPRMAFDGPPDVCCIAEASLDMGLAAGGRMRQKIYDDPHGVDTWDQSRCGRVYVHLCNAQQWHAITGEQAPALPREVEGYGGPWFGVADGGVDAVPGSDILNTVKSVDEIDEAAPAEGAGGIIVYQPNVPKPTTHKVHDGDW